MKSVQAYNSLHLNRLQIKLVTQLYFLEILKMTAKLKSNIFFIDSDQSSNQQNLPEKESKVSEKDTKQSQKAFNITGSHRLSNNLLSKGLFVNQTNQPDYEYEHPRMKSSPEIKLKQLPKKTLLRQKQSKQEQTIHLKSQVSEPIVKQQKEQKKSPQKNDTKKQSIKRSKTLMFQFAQQQSDNEIPKNEKKEQDIRNELETIAQKQAIQIHRQKSTEENSQVQTGTEKKPLTPANMQQKIDKKQFLLAQVGKNQILECRITKKNQLTNILLSQFDMRFRNYLSFIASCKKFIGSVGANYRLSLDIEDFRNTSRYVIGKIRSYEGKDIYNVYDDGVNPDTTISKNQKPREILATVRIKTQQGPRQLEVYILNHRQKYSELLGRNLGLQPNLETLYNIEGNRKNIRLYKSRKPQWIEQKREYFLNFRGKINQASIRNFILEDSETKEQVLLFGKSSNNNYNIDISYPLTPMLGFALVIPQLDRDD